MDAIQHQVEHLRLHRKLDQLVACYITETGKTPSETTVMELMEWSYMMTTKAKKINEKGK